MRAVGQVDGSEELDPDIRMTELRAKLIMEEAVETCAAMGFGVSATIYDGDPAMDDITGQRTPIVGAWWKHFEGPDFPEAIDGLCDLIYVVVGSAAAWGIDLDPFFAEVQRANMEKLQGPKREDGKQLKPEGWRPPDMERVLIRARENAERWKELESKVLGSG
jgi:predicted HAD superfamily Cof-like phosphohydrolase